MINTSIRSRLLQSLTGFQKVHLLLLLAGVLILILQITYGFLVERQLYFEPDSLIKIPVPDLDNKEELVWEWHDPKETPSFYKLFFINLFPFLFVLFSTIEFFQRKKGQPDRVKRTFFIVFGLLSLIGMYLIISEPLDLSEDTWLTKIMGSSHWQMNSLKIKERFWYESFAVWNILNLILFAFIYQRENKEIRLKDLEKTKTSKQYSIIYNKSWPGIYKLIFFALLIGFSILLSQIIFGCLVERQHTLENPNGLNISMTSEDWLDGSNWNLQSTSKSPQYKSVVQFNFLPTIFFLLALWVLFKLLKNGSAQILRVFFIIGGALLVIQMIIVLNRLILFISSYHAIRWAESSYMQNLKNIEWYLNAAYTIWAILTTILYFCAFKHQRNTNEKPPVSTPL